MSSEPDPAPSSPVERRARPRFDSSRIWEEASAMLLANREVLLAVLGVFCILPMFAWGQLLPLPQFASGETVEISLQKMGQYWDAEWLPITGVLIVELLGTLIILALLGDPQRPTVGEALRQALRNAPAFFAAFAAANIAALLAAVVPVIVIALLRAKSLALVASGMSMVVMIYMLVRFAFIGPLVLLGGEHNPLRALRRSFAMTKGIIWQLLLFLLLIYVALLVIGMLLTGGLSLVATLIGGTQAGLLVSNLAGSVVQAVQAATYVAVIAAAYRQLGGPLSRR